MSSKKNKWSLPGHRVAIEVSRSEVTLVVIEDLGDVREVRAHRVTWQEEGSLNCDDGLRDLTAAITTLAEKEKLAGAGVHVGLSSDFCVTRIIAGETEKVQLELRDLRERSSRYLLLGPGEKAVAQSSRAIDAKQIQSWLSVTNKRTLDNVVKAVRSSGLQVEFVEHAMLGMCRAVGKIGVDTNAPVIIIELNQHGVDLGVSYRGQLLFDYRPGGMDRKGRIGEITKRHLERIQRYCRRQFQFAEGTITKVFISGDRDDVTQVQAQFDDIEELNAEILNARDVISDCRFDEGFSADSNLLAPLGAALVDVDQLQAPSDERGIPDLMDFFRSGYREPILPTLVKATWPIAAAVLLSTCVLGGALMEGRKATALESQQAKFEADARTVSRLKMETQLATKKLGYLELVDATAENPAWHELLLMIGGSKPEGVWLNSVRVEPDRTVVIVGPSQSEDLIFAFMGYLKNVPVLREVNLESQQPISTATGPGIKFDIKCKYNDRNDLIERTASND